MNDYRFKFAELYQFFGGYFYQGWAAVYRWENGSPNFAAVVRHFKAVNPPLTINRVTNELEDLLALELGEEELTAALNVLGNNYCPRGEQLSHRLWLQQILEILRESSTEARVMRELQ